MKSFIKLVVIASLAGKTLGQAPINLQGNSSKPHPYPYTQDSFAHGQFTTPVPSSGAAFTFTLSASHRATAALIKNSAGQVARTLWSNRSYPAGTFGVIWDGLNDQGMATSASGIAGVSSGTVTTINVTNGGSFYPSAPTVTIAPPLSGGDTATATATITDGIVTGMTITHPGSGYTTLPALSLSPPPLSFCLTYNDIVATPDGIVADTNPYPLSPYSADGSYESFFTDMATMGNNIGTYAGGYDEGGWNATLFPLNTPGLNMRPLTNTVQGSDEVYRVATDGKLFYYADQPRFVNGDNAASNEGGVIAFDSAGNPHSFSAGSIFLYNYSTTNGSGGHFVNLGDTDNPQYLNLMVADKTKLPSHLYAGTSALTGIAVQRRGNILATAHGSLPLTSPGGTVPSGSIVQLMDKLTGANSTTVSIPNPQRMVFDTSVNENLWVISGDGFSGSNTLWEVTNMSATPTPAQVTSLGLSNPMALAISPVNGHLFIADGGATQQVIEYDLSTLTVVSRLGTAGGYGAGTGCNATISPYKFWFDMGQTDPGQYSAFAMFDDFIWADENGDLWVSQEDSGQILHYIWENSSWTYKDRQMYQMFSRPALLALNSSTRLFSGTSSFLEFQINNSLTPTYGGDPDPTQGGNGWWTAAYNWMPCIMAHPNYIANNPTSTRGTPIMTTPWVNSSQTVAMALFFDQAHTVQRASLNVGGTVTVQLNTDWAGPHPPDYLGLISSGGFAGNDPSHGAWTVNPVDHFDSLGLPVVSPTTYNRTYYTPNHAAGMPAINTPAPGSIVQTSNGIVPIYDGQPNTDISGSTTAFHLMGVTALAPSSPSGSVSQILWQALPQADTALTDGAFTFPAASTGNNVGNGAGGGQVTALNNFIFANYNGNGNSWSCQVWMYQDDGSPLIQMGYQASVQPDPLNAGEVGYTQSVPTGKDLRWKVPGFCGNENLISVAQITPDHYAIYLGDESYVHGVHRWDLTGIGGITQLNGTVVLGSTVVLR